MPGAAGSASDALTIGEAVRRMALRHPSRLAVVDGQWRLTYADLDERGNRVASALAGLGLAPGDRVAALLPNGAEYLELMVGAARAGLVLVPVNTRLSPPEVGYLLGDAGARALVYHARFAEPAAAAEASLTRIVVGAPGAAGRVGGAIGYEDARAAAARTPPPVRVAEDTVWALAYTSGTTSRPKGAILTHRAKLLSALVEAIEFRVTDTDVELVNTPLFHAHGLVACLIHLAVGGRVVLGGAGFDPERELRAIEEHGVTTVSMVPTMYQELLGAWRARPGAYDLRSLRGLRCTGAPLPESLKHEILDALPWAALRVFYGCTEGGAVTVLHPEDGRWVADSVGRAFLGSEVAVRDEDGAILVAGAEGLLYFRGPTMFSGYFGRGSDRAVYGDWFTLGDLAVQDEQGFVYLRGRQDDVIISGGENIYPREVEEAMASHPAVREAAVVGIPDPHWGETVKAVVVLEPGAEASAEALVAWCRQRLAGYKCPRMIEFAEALPRNAMGKVARRALLECGRGGRGAAGPR